jgi:hypothetical protein
MMSENMETNTPPAGEYFIAYDEDGYYQGEGNIISTLGGGVLFCEVYRYDTIKRRIVLPSESTHWLLVETYDELLEAKPSQQRRDA